MKRIIVFLVYFCFFISYSIAYNYDFYAYAPSGQRLYYSIISSSDKTVAVCSPNSISHPWEGFAKPTGDLIIPSTVQYGSTTYTVLRINSSTFSGCSGITSVQIPNTIELIGAFAFANCNLITQIVLPPNLKTIWRQAFSNTGISTINIPSSVIHIESSENILDNCHNLQSVTVSSGNTHYRSVNGLLYSYNGDTLFTFPRLAVPNGGVVDESFFVYNPSKIVEDFKNNDLITKITFPSNLKRIPGIINCPNLREITVGPNIIWIYDLHNLPALEKMTIHATEPPNLPHFYSESFETYTNIDTNISLYVPCGCIGAYQNHYNWKHFHNMYEFDVSFSAVSNNTSQGYVSVLTMPTCQNRMATVKATPYNGYEFDHWSDGSTSNPYNLYVSTDMTLVGYFKRKQSHTSVEDAEQPVLMAYGKKGTIFIKGDLDQPFFVYNIKGQCVYKGTLRGNTTIEVSCKGIYIVRFNNGIIKKVFVD